MVRSDAQASDALVSLLRNISNLAKQAFDKFTVNICTNASLAEAHQAFTCTLCLRAENKYTTCMMQMYT